MFKNLIIGICFTSVAFAGPKDNYIQRHNFVDITVDEPVIRLNVGYPGYQGRNCKLEFRSNFGFALEKNLEQLAKELEVAEAAFHGDKKIELTGEIASNVVTYPIKSLGGYVVWVDVKTRSGKTLKEVVSAAIPEETIGAKADPRVIVLLRDCKSANP